MLSCIFCQLTFATPCIKVIKRKFGFENQNRVKAITYIVEQTIYILTFWIIFNVDKLVNTK